jgi:hypothetical protein
VGEVIISELKDYIKPRRNAWIFGVIVNGAGLLLVFIVSKLIALGLLLLLAGSELTHLLERHWDD